MTIVDERDVRRRGGDHLPPLDTPATVPYLPWNEFHRYFRAQWRQGEHVGIIGPTGQGKTTLALNLIPLRRYMAVFATKPRDDVMAALIRDGYRRMSTWKYRPAHKVPRRILWPNARKLGSSDTQRIVFRDAFEKIYIEGGWTVFVDEMWYVVNQLKLGHEIKQYLLQARSLKVSLILLAQRPAWVPVETFDQCTHLFFFRENDLRNVQRISSIGFLDARVIQNAVLRLEMHHCLYINSRTGEMYITLAPKKDGV